MTAFLSFLLHLTALDWLSIGVAWLLIAAALGMFTGRGIRLADRRKLQPDPVFRIVSMYPPPVPAPVTPPFTQTVASADWFWAIPSDCLGDDAVRSLCDDIERREFS